MIKLKNQVLDSALAPLKKEEEVPKLKIPVNKYIRNTILLLGFVGITIVGFYILLSIL